MTAPHKSGIRRSKTLIIHCTPDEYSYFVMGAKKRGLPIAAFTRSLINAGVKATLPAPPKEGE